MAKELFVFDDDSIQRIKKAVRWFEKHSPQPDYAGQTPDMREDGSVAIYNKAAQVAPAHGVVWLRDWSLQEGRYKAWRPEYPGISRIGIAKDLIPAECPGWASIFGVEKVLVSDTGVLKVGDRIGATKNSFYAQRDELGPMQVVSILDDHGEETPPAGYVLVLITGERGDSVFVNGCVNGVHAPTKVWILGPGIQAVNEQPGVVRIECCPTTTTTTAEP